MRKYGILGRSRYISKETQNIFVIFLYPSMCGVSFDILFLLNSFVEIYTYYNDLYEKYALFKLVSKNVPPRNGRPYN